MLFQRIDRHAGNRLPIQNYPTQKKIPHLSFRRRGGKPDAGTRVRLTIRKVERMSVSEPSFKSEARSMPSTSQQNYPGKNRWNLYQNAIS